MSAAAPPAAKRSSGGGWTADRLIKRLFGDFKSRHVLVAAFVALLLTSTGITSWLLVVNGRQATQAVLVEVASRIGDNVREEVSRFLRAPDRINDYVASAITAPRVTVDDSGALHRLFWDAPRDDETTVSSIYVGTTGGTFVGLDSRAVQWPPTGWRYTVASRSTSGALVYLPTDEDGRVAGEPIVSAAYDPRERPWFVRAAESEGPVWTGIYANFDNGVSTLTRAVALHDARGRLLGVAGVDLFLDHLQGFLHELDLGVAGEVFLIDSDGTLIGAHAGGDDDEHVEALGPVTDAEQRFTRAAGEFLERAGEGYAVPVGGRHERVVLDGEPGWLSLTALGRDQGLEWSLGVFVPESDYVAPLGEQLLPVVPLALLTLAIALGTFAVFAELVVKPLRQLRNGASRIAVGEFDVPIDTSCGNEVGDLARAIDAMRNRLRGSFDELSEQKLQAETTLESITDGVVMISSAGTVRYMNSVAERLTGTAFEDARGRSVETVFRARDERTGVPLTRGLILRSMADSHAIGQAVVMTSADGSTHLVHCRVSPVVRSSDGVDDGNGFGAVLNFSDLSEELRLKSELARQATYDSLTHLVNRREFERRLTRAVERARRRGTPHVLCYVDLDQFKLVNDGAGHEAGDELLRQVARLLDESVRGGDTVGRLGGDEFGVLLENCTLGQATRIVEKLRARVERFRFIWGERSHGIGISAGLVAIGADSGSMVAVMRDADSACYIAKEAGRNRVHVHHEDDERLMRLRGERSWIERIERALENDRFSLRAQRIEASDAAAAPHRHVEILLRLVDDAGQPLSPAEFLPAAERYDLGARIDRWVVANALDWLASLPDGAGPDLCSINLSGQSLGDETSLAFIVERIRRSGVAPARLCFEVTETATIANLSNALALIGTLRELGCSFALDDFGSGLSSFAYLKTLPVDYLKIDGLFVRDMLDDPLDLAMVRSFNEVGQTMGMRTIAEYVESRAIRDALRDLGVDYVQGYAIGRPEPLEALSFPAMPLPSAVGCGD